MSTDDDLLDRYHARAGRTVEVFADWQDIRGRTTYGRMVEDVRAIVDPATSRVLDLACGDGYLLGLLSEVGLERLCGVDRSQSELRAARTRLGPAIELRNEDARSLSLPTRSIDVVTCHMALMLMGPLEPVLEQIARVLAPGGVLLATLNRPLYDPAYELYRRLLQQITAEFGLPRMTLGDPRAYQPQALQEIARGRFFDGSPALVDFEVQTTIPPRCLWSRLSLMYDVFRLPRQAQAELKRRTLRAWAPLVDASGLITCRLGMRSLRCATPSYALSPSLDTSSALVESLR